MGIALATLVAVTLVTMGVFGWFYIRQSIQVNNLESALDRSRFRETCLRTDLATARDELARHLRAEFAAEWNRRAAKRAAKSDPRAERFA